MSAEKKENKRLIVICGPTAVGKTQLSIALAQHLNTVILSADSRQFYREMNTATAKPTEEELDAVTHYFINNLSIHDEYSAGDFERDGLALLSELFLTKRDVLLVGGSGLYIDALVSGMDAFPDVDPGHIADIEMLLIQKGLSALQEELKKSDPAYYETVDLNNPVRLIRALSVCRQSGRPFSSFRTGERRQRNFEVEFIRLGRPREELYLRIEERVDEFIQNGLWEEARLLLPLKHLKPLQTLGYTEAFQFLEGQYTEQQAIEKIKQHSRNYAKRQETWLRKKAGAQIWHPSQQDEILDLFSS